MVIGPLRWPSSPRPLGLGNLHRGPPLPHVKSPSPSYDLLAGALFANRHILVVARVVG